MGWKQTSRWIFNKNTLRVPADSFFQTLVTNIMPPQEHNTCSRHVNSVVSCATDMISTVCGIDRSLRDRPWDGYIKKNKKKLWNIFFVLVSLWFSCLSCSSALTNAECFLIGAGVFNLQYKAWGNWWIEAISNACLTTLTRGCFSVKVCQTRVGQLMFSRAYTGNWDCYGGPHQ